MEGVTNENSAEVLSYKLVHTNGILSCGNGKELHSRVNEENVVKPESFGFNLLTVGNSKF